MSATLDPALIERVAAEHRLVQRSGGSVEPCELILSLCAASCAGPARSIAEARRQWELRTGQTIARSSFDEHFDKEALGDSIRDLLRRMMARSNRALRRQWPGALRELFDVILDDGSRMKLRKAAADQFPATEANAAGLKLMAGIGSPTALPARTARSTRGPLRRLCTGRAVRVHANCSTNSFAVLAPLPVRARTRPPVKVLRSPRTYGSSASRRHRLTTRDRVVTPA